MPNIQLQISAAAPLFKIKQHTDAAVGTGLRRLCCARSTFGLCLIDYLQEEGCSMVQCRVHLALAPRRTHARQSSKKQIQARWCSVFQIRISTPPQRPIAHTASVYREHTYAFSLLSEERLATVPRKNKHELSLKCSAKGKQKPEWWRGNISLNGDCCCAGGIYPL